MKVLFIGTTDTKGGAAKVAWEIKRTLEMQGHQTSMFVADKLSADKNVRVIPRPRWRKILGFLLTTENLISTDWILETKKFKEADIIHCHNLHGRFFNLKTLQKMSLLKPVVWTLHDEWAITPHCACTMEGTEMKNGLFVCPSKETPPRILRDNTRHLSHNKISIYEKSKLNIVVPSNWLLERVKKTVLKKQDIRLIPNGINTTTFKNTDKTTARKKLNLPLDKKIVLFLADAAKDNPWKGWQYTKDTIKYFKKDKSILFLNVGNTNVYENEDNIEYRSYVKNTDELALYYNSADCLLFTSVAENFPLVILEAMSCGLPIVSFDVGGVKEVVKHLENGFIAQYKNSTELKNGLNWTLSLTPQERNQLADKSREKITSNYDVNHMTNGYVKLYKELINK